jgi:hypothetical protein
MHAENEDELGIDAILVTFEVARQVAIGAGTILAFVVNALYFLSVLASSKEQFIATYLFNVLVVAMGLVTFATLLKSGIKRIWTRLGARAPTTSQQINSRSSPALFFLTRFVAFLT